MTLPNEPAFVGILDNTLQYVPGLTKREYFAGLAMQGFIASGKADGDFAEWSVKNADALIAELNK